MLPDFIGHTIDQSNFPLTLQSLLTEDLHWFTNQSPAEMIVSDHPISDPPHFVLMRHHPSQQHREKFKLFQAPMHFLFPSSCPIHTIIPCPISWP
jgi:hypothetical protein